ncbi:hypothetical protein NBRC10512_006013 [Rhodotorula toruloides]|uniref:RHTO0S20e01640g1_1 n=2 Tax=Rhodotorula toruloides TaxID=5286 RepID=A0A061BNZ7_RHOTO|nr:uncharacterized protein RHTO_04317 [Rhodotorula toruloides NP11]EMS19543.1 hypothetical protein RHTO_04317 [Rhodotorula toruloides NP11]CDR48799.1 RHTO0S20e01640g1_1 [Rhodotorula toruloides]
MPAARFYRFASVFLAAAVAVTAQLETVVDAISGNTVVVSIVTDAAGDPLQTLILSFVTDPAAAVADTVTATTTSSTTTAAAVNNPGAGGVQGVGQPANVLTPAATCTTEGCPPMPTTYTQNGAIVTWYATTPATPIPTWTSSGQIESAAKYISTVSSGQGGRAISGAGSRFSSFPIGTTGDWGIMFGAAVIGGLVGAVAVL